MGILYQNYCGLCLLLNSRTTITFYSFTHSLFEVNVAEGPTNLYPNAQDTTPTTHWQTSQKLKVPTSNCVSKTSQNV